jgi:(p)ppGpp synthase/HD superfamily hydrolase
MNKTIQYLYFKVLTYVKLAYLGQVRKGTAQTLTDHAVQVANELNDYKSQYVVTALLHDIIEEADFTLEGVHRFLVDTCKVDTDFADEVCQALDVLTNEATKKSMPNVGRAKRHRINAARYLNALKLTKIVKLADIYVTIKYAQENNITLNSFWIEEKKDLVYNYLSKGIEPDTKILVKTILKIMSL